MSNSTLTPAPQDPGLAGPSSQLREGRTLPQSDNDVKTGWQGIFPPDKTPYFLVDLGPDSLKPNLDDAAIQKLQWKTVIVQNLPQEDMAAAKELWVSGWSAISYAWGEYQPDRSLRPIFSEDRQASTARLPIAVGDSYDPTKRSMKPNNKYDWQVPKVDRINVQVLKKIFYGLKKRFAWWDWVCVPQNDCSEGYGPKEKKLPKDLQDISAAEVAKQRYVYANAAIGATWVHTLDFTQQDTPLKTVLKSSSSVFDPSDIKAFFTQDAAENPDPKQLDVRLKVIYRAMGLPIFGKPIDPKATDAQKKQGLLDLTKRITDLADQIMAVREGDAYFRSLWSFQEVRLLQSQYLVDGAAKSLPMTFIGQPTQKDINASFLHIAYIATFFASQLSLALAVAKNDQLKTVAGLEPAQDLVTLCNTAADNQQTRKLIETTVQRVTSSGLVFSPQETPLQVLAGARRSRFPSFRTQDNYYAMQGCLALDGPYAIKANYSGKIQDQRRSFLSSLIKKYQWKMLELAKLPQDPSNSWDAIALGHFESTTAYYEAFIAHQKASNPDLKYTLPVLSYHYTSTADEIRMAHTDPWKTFTAWKLPADLSTTQSLIYNLQEGTTTWFNPEGPLQPDGSRDPSKWPMQLPVAPSMTLNGSKLTNNILGNSDRLLIPMERLSDTWSQLQSVNAPPTDLAYARCLLLEQVTTGPDRLCNAVFGGIVDVKDLPLPAASVLQLNEVRLMWQ